MRVQSLVVGIGLSLFAVTTAQAQTLQNGSFGLVRPGPAGGGIGPNAATAQGVALNTGGCSSPNSINITLQTDGAPTTETGIASSASGVLMSFSQSTGFQNFSGTFNGYNYSSPSYSSPANTQVGLYASIGQVPPTGLNTAEFFLIFNCTTNVVSFSCFGPYGTCPQTVAQAVPALPAAGYVLLLLALAFMATLSLTRRRRLA